ncbi:MAG TPA: hypothetical protein VFX30_13475 [bacterium]|nr:hypothetical protein [bacterium]
MTECRDVPAGLDRNWQNISEMYVALGVRRAGDAGTALAPPSTYAESQTLTYMVGPSGAPRRSIDISLFNDADARACFFRWAGYDETSINARVTALRNEHPDDQAAADQAVATYLATLPALQQQIYRVVGMISIFQQDYRREGGRNVGGGNRANPDSPEAANPNIITDYEIQQYAAEALEGGDENPEYVATGGRILNGIHAIMGLMHYVTTPAPVAPPPVDAGTGPRVVAVTPADAGTNAPAVNNNNQGGSDWHLPSWLAPVLGGLGLGTVATYLIMRSRRGTPPTGGNTPPNRNNPPRTDNNPPRQDGEGTRADRRSSNPPPPPAARVAAANPNPNPPPAADDIFLDDIDQALAEAKGSQSPGVARVAGGSPAALVSPENVIIKGATAEPVSGVTEDVIRSQIVLQYREFLSQGAREALQDNGTLPTGNELVNSDFAREVQEITDLVVADYHKRMTTDEGRRALADLWENQRSERGYIVRRGVPSNMLREVAGRYIAEHSSNSGSPFAGGVGAQLRTDAERHAGETEFFERSMPRVLRAIGR